MPKGENTEIGTTKPGPSVATSVEWSKVRYECLVRPGGSKRAEPHAKNHRDGCLAHYPCGCVQRYYSGYYYANHGFRFYSPDRTLLTAAWDGLCPVHFKMRLDSIYGGAKQ